MAFLVLGLCCCCGALAVSKRRVAVGGAPFGIWGVCLQWRWRLDCNCRRPAEEPGAYRRVVLIDSDSLTVFCEPSGHGMGVDRTDGFRW